MANLKNNLGKQSLVEKQLEKEVFIRSLSHDGRGIAEIKGKTIFIENALSNETVEVLVQKRHSRYDEGIATAISNASTDRTTPLCPHFEQCGGCQLQHLSTDAQLQLKQTVLLEQLQHFGNVQAQTILPPLRGPQYGYRRKARLGVKFVIKKNKVLIGFREKRSNKLADLSSCEILHPTVGQLIIPLQNLITNLKAYQTIPQIEVAVGDTKTALVFRVLEPLCNEDLAKLELFAKEQNQKPDLKLDNKLDQTMIDRAKPLASPLASHRLVIYLQPGNAQSVYALESTEESLNYTISIEESIENSNANSTNNTNTNITNVQYYFHPLDFMQVNAVMNQQMVSKVLELLKLKPSDEVLDLFCGLGNFTLPMALQAKKVVGVEGSEIMITRAIENAKLNNIENVEFYVDNLQPENNVQFSSNWKLKKFNKILLDPPRTGAKEIIDLLPTLGCTRIVYVSCNPATLARDIGILVNTHGFRLTTAGIMDMFPHTAHVESIAVLDK